MNDLIRIALLEAALREAREWLPEPPAARAPKDGGRPVQVWTVRREIARALGEPVECAAHPGVTEPCSTCAARGAP